MVSAKKGGGGAFLKMSEFVFLSANHKFAEDRIKLNRNARRICQSNSLANRWKKSQTKKKGVLMKDRCTLKISQISEQMKLTKWDLKK